MKRIILAGIICMFCSGLFGQTFLGKKYYVNIGTAISPTIGFMKNYADDARFKTDYTVFPSKIELECGVAANQTTSFSFSAFFRGLPNSQYTIEKESYNNNEYVKYAYDDQYRLGTNMLNIGLNLKLHTEYAPFGPYVKFGVGYNRAWSTVYPTLNTVNYVYYGDYYNQPSTFSEYRKLAPWKETSQFVNISLGLGKAQLITKNWYVDYGFQLGIFLNFYNPGTGKYDPNASPEALKKSTRLLTQKVAAANALSSNLFQLYVKFGFSK